MIDLSLTVTPTYCNHWPELTISFNDIVEFQHVIDKSMQLNLSFEEQDFNRLTIGLSNKSFGENGMWDTAVNESGDIVNDLTLTIDEALINDVSIIELLIKNQYTVNKSPSQSNLDDIIYSNGTMYFNGYFTFEYTQPVLNSIINQKFKQPVNNEKSYFSNYTELFHYEKDLKLIEEITEILNEAKKLSS